MYTTHTMYTGICTLGLYSLYTCMYIHIMNLHGNASFIACHNNCVVIYFIMTTALINCGVSNVNKKLQFKILVVQTFIFIDL